MTFSLTTANLIANLGASKIIRYLNLEEGQSFLVSTLLSSIIISLDLSFFKTDYIIYILPFLIIGLSLYFYKCRDIIDEDYIYAHIYQSDDYISIKYFYDKHPEFFDKYYSVERYNPRFRNSFRDFIPINGTKIMFNDRLHNITGYITNHEISVSDDRDKSIRCMILALKKGQTMNCMEYINTLDTYRCACIEKNKIVTLYYKKVLSIRKGGDVGREGVQKIYDGPIDNLEERQIQYMNSYFSPNKKELWNYISAINFKENIFKQFGQEACCNLLLYGRPGSGKSTFGYRLAMCLNRHIISIDIDMFVNDKSRLYKLIREPEIYDERDCGGSNKYIILFEEFDVAIKKLIDKRKIDTSPMSFFHISTSKDETKEKNEVTISPPINDELQLEDLLDILQGPVPNIGSIIIATTNHYEEIKNMCPALFRPGRLTPVHFDYLDWDSLQELSFYYFKEKLDFCPINKIDIATSQIIEYALQGALKGENGFDYFKEQLKSKLCLK